MPVPASHSSRPAASSIDSGDSNFRFYVRSGTFGAINLGPGYIIIPSNVRITTVDTNGPVYLSDPVTLPASATQAYFSARSLFAGTVSNSPATVFNRHNFTNYAESRFGSLLVTNDFGIVGGRDQEDDDSYRYRIHLKLISQSGSDEAALRFALLQVPGIQDVVFDRRAGTFICYVMPSLRWPQLPCFPLYRTPSIRTSLSLSPATP